MLIQSVESVHPQAGLEVQGRGPVVKIESVVEGRAVVIKGRLRMSCFGKRRKVLDEEEHEDDQHRRDVPAIANG